LKSSWEKKTAFKEVSIDGTQTSTRKIQREKKRLEQLRGCESGVLKKNKLLGSEGEEEKNKVEPVKNRRQGAEVGGRNWLLFSDLSNYKTEKQKKELILPSIVPGKKKKHQQTQKSAPKGLNPEKGGGGHPDLFIGEAL